MTPPAPPHRTTENYQLHAELCQALSDPNRISLLYSLRGGRRNVGELAERLTLPQPTVSRHLKVLRDRGVVRAEREGSNVYYELADRRVLQALELLREVIGSQIREHATMMDRLA